MNGRRARPLILLAYLVLTSTGARALPAAGAEDTTPIAIIVGRNEALRTVDQDMLARVFLRQQQFWPNREPILPVNLDGTNPLRQLFSERVLKASPDDLENYWNDQYFHGVFPPYSVSSEEAVLRFVATTPQAIGYVSACHLDARVRAILFLTRNGPTRQVKLNCADGAGASMRR